MNNFDAFALSFVHCTSVVTAHKEINCTLREDFLQYATKGSCAQISEFSLVNFGYLPIKQMITQIKRYNFHLPTNPNLTFHSFFRYSFHTAKRKMKFLVKTQLPNAHTNA
eukprot:TRINITY_DN4121_c0_g2_i3.p1 TRINITY_DN4121_c0_g2~~TRINITY_DN4121_c0_g2_i3.p1  ORF type:complete len:110 (-),score=5.53 TRINITY_DN4121_c0_g2_i3:35-364(-)